MFKIIRSSRSSKCLKTTVEINVNYTKSKRLDCLFCFQLQILFWVNLVQKLKIISLSWSFVPGLIQIWRIPWWCSLFLSLTGNSILCKFGPKNQICQFELKLGIKTNFNKQNSMMMFTFCVIEHKYPSWANLVQKFKLVCSKSNLIQRLIRISKT